MKLMILIFTGGKDYVFLKPDRVALQDVTGQMVMLQFMQAELKTNIFAYNCTL